MNTKSWSGAEIEQLIELYRNFFYIDFSIHKRLRAFSVINFVQYSDVQLLNQPWHAWEVHVLSFHSCDITQLHMQWTTR